MLLAENEGVAETLLVLAVPSTYKTALAADVLEPIRQLADAVLVETGKFLVGALV
jgi:hypothetical protein